ncbi:hypothetical protein Droror1_Dr00027771 [Drosera rotundifolia]
MGGSSARGGRGKGRSSVGIHIQEHTTPPPSIGVTAPAPVSIAATAAMLVVLATPAVPATPATPATLSAREFYIAKLDVKDAVELAALAGGFSFEDDGGEACVRASEGGRGSVGSGDRGFHVGVGEVVVEYCVGAGGGAWMVDGFGYLEVGDRGVNGCGGDMVGEAVSDDSRGGGGKEEERE